MKAMTCEWKTAAVILLADRLAAWGTQLKHAAQQSAAARAGQQTRRLAAACRNESAARRLAVYQARREEWRAGQNLR